MNDLSQEPSWVQRSALFQSSIVLLCLGFISPVWADDVVIFTNGDRLSGTIKSLDRGVLIMSAPVLDGDSNLNWNKIARVESDRLFQFQTSAGRRFLGRVANDDVETQEGRISVLVDGAQESLNPIEIVKMAQTVSGLSGFLAVTVGGGLAITKSNDQKQFTADASASYETTGYRTNAYLNSLFTTQANGSNTNRQNVRASFVKKLPRRWGVGVLSDFLTSDEQELELRTIVGGLVTRDFLRTNSIELRALGGSVWNNERYREEADASTDNNGLEGLAGVQVSLFHFREWGVDSTLLTFPSFSNAGRFRLDWTANLRVRLIKNRRLWWNINQTINFDSKPPPIASGTDYVTKTSITWELP